MQAGTHITVRQRMRGNSRLFAAAAAAGGAGGALGRGKSREQQRHADLVLSQGSPSSW